MSSLELFKPKNYVSFQTLSPELRLYYTSFKDAEMSPLGLHLRSLLKTSPENGSYFYSLTNFNTKTRVYWCDPDELIYFCVCPQSLMQIKCKRESVSILNIQKEFERIRNSFSRMVVIKLNGITRAVL